MSNQIPKGKQSLREVLAESVVELKKEGFADLPNINYLLKVTDSSAKRKHTKKVLRKSTGFSKTKKLKSTNKKTSKRGKK